MRMILFVFCSIYVFLWVWYVWSRAVCGCLKKMVSVTQKVKILSEQLTGYFIDPTGAGHSGVTEEFAAAFTHVASSIWSVAVGMLHKSGSDGVHVPNHSVISTHPIDNTKKAILTILMYHPVLTIILVENYYDFLFFLTS